MKKILSYMGAALIMVGPISPFIKPEAPVTNQVDNSTVSNVQEEKLKIEPKVEVIEEQPEVQVAQVEVAPPVQPAPVAKPVSGSCEDWMTQAGVTDMASAAELIRRESNCRVNALNPSSGAYGIPQSLPASKMASAGEDWQTNPVTQIKWMQNYVTARYGSWANAVAFHDRNNWY